MPSLLIDDSHIGFRTVQRASHLRSLNDQLVGLGAKWAPVVGKFFGGQVIAQALNLLTALLLLRWLPVHQYALYVLANVLIAVGSVGSDLGLSAAVTTLGSQVRDKRPALSSLYASALRLRRSLFVLATVASLCTSPFIFRGHGWSLASVVACLSLVLLNNWVQQANALRTSLLNIHHNGPGLLVSSVSGSIGRLVLVLGVTRLLPFAVVALSVNVVASLVIGVILRRYSERYVEKAPLADSHDTERLRAFALPLVARTVYFLFQGNIALLLIGHYGVARSIAEVGALSRLGQVMTVFMMLNGFVFQPAFARVRSKSEFIRKLSIAAGAILVFVAVVQSSAFAVPHWWLLLLGPQYESVRPELAWAIGGIVAEYLGEFIFVVLLARGYTGGQWWYIVCTLAAQVAFVAWIGADTTHKAVMLNLVSRATVLVVQLSLLVLLLRRWDLHTERIGVISPSTDGYGGAERS